MSNVTEEGLPKLREVVHKVALKMQDCHTHEPIIGKMVSDDLHHVQIVLSWFNVLDG